MTTNPPEAPADPGQPGQPDGPERHDPADGPRVTRDEIRDLARLRRSRDDRKIAGVAGGLARHFDIDPLIPRVVLVVLAFFGGAGLLLYGVIWLIVPSDGADDATVRLDDRSRTVALGVVGVLAALLLVGDSFGGWGFPWPIFLVGVVVLVVMLSRGREPRLHPLLRQGAQGGQGVQGGYAGQPPPSRRRGPVLFWYALALIALALGALGMVDLAGARVVDSAYPALALGICAATLLLAAFWGRGGGLILLGLMAAVATAGTTAADQVDAGHVEATPTSAAMVSDRYDLTFGEIDLDLTEVADLDNLDGRTIEVEVDVGGRIEVTVPHDVDVTVESRVDAGERRIFGERDSDSPRSVVVDGGPDAPELTLDLQVAFGEIEVNREGDS